MTTHKMEESWFWRTSFCFIKKMTDRPRGSGIHCFYLFIQEITLEGSPFGFVKETKFAQNTKENNNKICLRTCLELVFNII